jgi:hypothetical protein
MVVAADREMSCQASAVTWPDGWRIPDWARERERDGFFHNVLEMSQTETGGCRKAEMPISC